MPFSSKTRTIWLMNVAHTLNCLKYKALYALTPDLISDTRFRRLQVFNYKPIILGIIKESA